jgi:hypothetical protein
MLLIEEGNDNSRDNGGMKQKRKPIHPLIPTSSQMLRWSNVHFVAV